MIDVDTVTARTAESFKHCYLTFTVLEREEVALAAVRAYAAGSTTYGLVDDMVAHFDARDRDIEHLMGWFVRQQVAFSAVQDILRVGIQAGVTNTGFPGQDYFNATKAALSLLFTKVIRENVAADHQVCA